MACERYRDALSDVAAGEPATPAVEGHLASCEACRAELHALRRTLAVADAEMAGLASAEPSPGLAARIRQAAAEAKASGSALDRRPSPAWRLGWLWPVMAAAAALLVALAVVQGRGTRETPDARVAVDAEPPGEEAPPADEPASTEAFPGKRPTPQIVPRADPRFRRVGTRDDGPSEPEVLVPPGEGEALLRFVALVHRDGVSPAQLASAGQDSVELAEPSPIEIAPLTIVPLDPAEIAGTD
jgi:hypothetical protein